ncbi:uncharacterized protein E0L32_010533 [Thyridium curvatum]|uniref:ER membrane protein complex subunit 1 n=1 Tax=Thyridium curvatum TaxID=1093900 RepID=A0A507AS69_9PEZI|nr:uncharacterized protein E0L32_010533 [Thyridium curvatum]TPX07741.1 hypothetical protein E0L32_010533 [Thyridium curvatum]
MRPYLLAAAIGLPFVTAVFRDEVDVLDFHHERIGVPQSQTTFFHRPRLDDKASLLYTLSDVGILGAVNPGNGALVWRQQISTNLTSGGGHLRAGEGEGWLAGAQGRSVHSWNAVTGRNVWWLDFDGSVKDLEVMEMTENAGRKDVLALFSEDGATVLRRVHATEGTVVWEFREKTKDVPLQVSTNIEKVFVVSLHGSAASYSLRVTVLDTLTGKKLDEHLVGTKGEVGSEKDVMFVGANSAAPVLSWTDDSLSKLRINVLGTKKVQEFPLEKGTVEVLFHAPHAVQAQAHFLVHSRTSTGHRGTVYHIDLKSGSIQKAYDLPLAPGKGAFSTSSSGANVYFTRLTEDEVILTASTSHGILGRWPIKPHPQESVFLDAVSEVIKKSEDSYAVRSAAVTDSNDWVLVRNGEVGWSRAEGMTGAVAAAFAEIPESEDFVKTLEAEAHSNPLSAYIHRVNRHIKDLEHLPAYLKDLPSRLLGSILGTELAAKTGLVRDNFGFNKLVVLATKRGQLYGLDFAHHGKLIWSRKVIDLPPGEAWDVKGIHVDNNKGVVTIQGAEGEHIMVKSMTGEEVDMLPRGALRDIVTTAVVDSPSGQWLLPINKDGDVGDIPVAFAPKQIIVVPNQDGGLKGLKFSANGETLTSETTWEFSLPAGQRIVNVASRPAHDPVASIGRVLGDRSVKYKYLNPNTIVVAAVEDSKSVLTINLLDTVSGEILSSQTYEGIDATKPIECAISENWFLCTYFGQYALKDSTQSLRGYQIVISDLYESEEVNDRGPLGNAANYSSLEPIDTPTGIVLPSVVSQSFVLGAPLSALAISQSRQGITTRSLLACLPESHGIVGLPRTILEPRRPVGRDPTPAEIEEGLMKYFPSIEIDPKLVITHEREVIGVQKILTTPTLVESTTLVLAYGIDVFGTRVAPSFAFDILGKGFNKVALIGTVLALGVGVMFLGPVVRRKQINLRWKAPM